MRRTARWIHVALILAGVAVSVSSASSQSPSTASASSPQAQRAVLERYCITCHSQTGKDKGLVPVALDTLDLARVGRSDNETETWEKVVRKVNSGVMPPPGAPRPDREIGR